MDAANSAFPLMQTVYLCECGTHAIVDAGCWPYATSERKGGKRMLRSVTEGMLVMWDRGFHAHEMIRGVMDRGAHLLSRLPAHVKPRFRGRLPDGTWLGTLASSTQPDAPPVTVRIVEYHITDPKRDGFGERHRLITTLIDPNTYPAFQLAALYHERWEVELAIDEMDTHQRLADRPFRSKKPVGVIQEFYGLLLAHFVVRSVIHEAAVTHEMDPDRISFVQALRLVARSIMEFQLVHPRGHTALWQRLLTNVSHRLLPQRRRRSNPRVVKRKMSKFRRKRPKHQSIRFDKPFLRSLSLQERSVGSSA